MVKPRLSINDFSVFAHLGCSDEERQTPQEISLSVEMEFPATPPGEKTDCLEDTLCYAEVCETLRGFINGREFNLVEKMARDCFCLLQKKYPSMAIRLTLHKMKPPVESLRGGVKYTCGEMF